MVSVQLLLFMMVGETTGITTPHPQVHLLVVMGVSGSGKSTIGSMLDKRLKEKAGSSLRSTFLDADDFHSPQNIAKMRQGIPLTDEDRVLWLKDLRSAVDTEAKRNTFGQIRLRFVVLACSALRLKYRQALVAAEDQYHRMLLYSTTFVYLRCDVGNLKQRLMSRKGHFFKESLLASQLSTLEEPNPKQEPAVVIDVAACQTPAKVVDNIILYLDCWARQESPFLADEYALCLTNEGK